MMIKFGRIAVVSAAAFAGALVGSLIVKAPQKSDAPSVDAAVPHLDCSREPEKLECVMGQFYVVPKGPPGL